MFIELGEVNLFEFGHEQRLYTIDGFYQTEPGMAFGKAERLLDGNGKQRRHTTHLDLVVNKIRKVVNHLLRETELTEDV